MNKLQLYIHGENSREPKLIEIQEKATVDDVIQKCLHEFSIEGSINDFHLFVEDEEEPRERGKNIEDHAIKKRFHLHCHRCKKINVLISYNGETKDLVFSPSDTIKKIMKKVLKEFKIDPSDAGDYLLKLVDGTVLQLSDQIGSFASHKDCQVQLFLTPTRPVQG